MRSNTRSLRSPCSTSLLDFGCRGRRETKSTNCPVTVQSVTLPAKVATQVRSLAKRRRLSANRVLVELVEAGIEAKKQKERAFFELAEQFRTATDPQDVDRLGEELGHMAFDR